MAWLILLRGLPGSGKSTLSDALSRRLGWPVIDKDDVKDVLDPQTPASGWLAYQVMLRVARRQLVQGLSVLCDSPLTFADVYDGASRIAAEAGARIAVVECRCDDERILQDRVEGRGDLELPAHHVSDWDAFNAARRRMLPEMEYALTDPHLVVDTARPLAEIITQVEAWLDQLAAEEEG